MSDYKFGTRKETPEGHVVHPDCSAERHGFYSAYRHDHCVCPGPGRDAFERSVLGQRRAEAAQRAAARKPRAPKSPTAVPPARGTATWPPVREAARLEKQLWARNDLACATVDDPDVFTVIGTGPAAREQARGAAAICRTCPAFNLCRQVGLSVDRPETFMGGLTYSERCDIRRGWQQVAA